MLPGSLPPLKVGEEIYCQWEEKRESDKNPREVERETDIKEIAFLNY